MLPVAREASLESETSNVFLLVWRTRKFLEIVLQGLVEIEPYWWRQWLLGAATQVETEEHQRTLGTEATSGRDVRYKLEEKGNRNSDIFILNIFVMVSPYFPYHIILSVLKPIAAKTLLLWVSHCTQKIIFIAFCQEMALTSPTSCGRSGR